MLRLKREFTSGVLKIWDRKDGNLRSITLTSEMAPIQETNNAGQPLYDIDGEPVFERLGTPFECSDEEYILKNHRGIIEKVFN